MDFVKTKLEKLTDLKLDIISLTEFIEELYSTSSQNTKQAKDAFLEKWKKEPYPKGLKLACLHSGTWKPQCASNKELRNQLPWDDFLSVNFSSSLKGNATSTRDFVTQPCNFRELVQVEFWPNMYQTFGLKALNYIFEKSLILSEVEEGFFLVIGSEKCMLYQKISKAFSLKRKALEPLVERNNFFNPYHLKTGSLRSESNFPSSTTASTKKCRLTLRDDPILLENQLLTDRTNNEVPIKAIRWIKPTEKILKIVIEEREKNKSSAYLSIPVVVHPISNGMKEMNFLGIIEVGEFSKIALDEMYVIKKSHMVKFPMTEKAIDKLWMGLKIPEASSTTTSSLVYINIYRISETFARHHNIHIKVKQRRKVKCCDPLTNAAHKTVEKQKVTVHNMTPDEVPDAQKKNEGRLKQLSLQSSDDSNLIARPYDPFLILNTSSVLYNRSSWSNKWPNNHIMPKACSSTSLDDGIKLLRDCIFSTIVGSTANEYDILNIISLPEMNELSTILGKVITFHKRVKNIHQLVKSCLTFWNIKMLGKIDKREQRKTKRKEWKTSNPGSNILQQDQSIEMIDLTIDSPNSATPDFVFPNQSIVGDTTILSDHDAVGTFNSSEIKLSDQSTIKERRKFSYDNLKKKIPPSCLLMTFKQIFHLSNLDALLGSKKNCRNFFSFLRKSVVLAGTKSSLQFGQLMALLDPAQCKWLNPIKCKSTKLTLLAKISMWLFVSYVLVILKMSFYITEGMTSRNHTEFHLREAWKSVTEHIKHRYIKQANLKKIGPFPTRPSQIKRSNESINAIIRFVPKKNNDLRPILSLKPDRDSERKKNVSQCKLIINCIVMKYSPHRVRDMNLLRTRWLKFLHSWKDMGCPKLYYVKADIQDAYPSVNIAKLKKILIDRAKSLGTVINKEFKVISRSRILYRQTLVSENTPELWNASIFTRPCIVQDKQVNECRLNPVDVIKQLFSSLEGQTIRLGKHKYSFEYGLPQGWVLSEGLCNIYYGQMDCKYFSNMLNKAGDFLTTSVDDYLFVTPNVNRALEFYKKLETGMPEYGCKSNASKILTNLFPSVNFPIPSQECEWVDFCGWKFCLTCGHIMRDFSNYEGQDMASSLTFTPKNAKSPENFIIARMKTMLPVRLQKFLLDPAINCRRRIIMNIYEAGLIFSFRLYALCRVVYPNLNALSEPNRAMYIVSAIYACVKTLSRMVTNIFHYTYPARLCVSKCCKGRSSCPCIKTYHTEIKQRPSKQKRRDCKNQTQDVSAFIQSPLQEAEVFLIAYHAFIIKLKKHAHVFRQEVLPKLYKMRHYQKSLISAEKYDFLIKVLGNRMPTHFENIKI